MSARYAMKLFDCAGEFSSTPAEDIYHAIELALDAPKGKLVRVVNLDNVDLGCSDGLTEDERDAVEEALSGDSRLADGAARA
jgi:hypothetical protein